MCASTRPPWWPVGRSPARCAGRASWTGSRPRHPGRGVDHHRQAVARLRAAGAAGGRTAGRAAGLRQLRRDDHAGRPAGRRPGRPADLRRDGHHRSPQRVRSAERLVRGRPGDRLAAGEAFRAVFIRAPEVVASGPAVEVLATVPRPDGSEHVVAVRQGSLLATAFHPEVGWRPSGPRLVRGHGPSGRLIHLVAHRPGSGSLDGSESASRATLPRPWDGVRLSSQR